MNRADSFAPRYYGGDPLARAAKPALTTAPQRMPLVEYPGGAGEEDAFGELRYMPVQRQGKAKKRRLSRGMLAYFICSAAIVLGLTAFYLVREERVASANAACTQLERENSALLVSYEAKRTQYECSTDIEAVREIASQKMRMGYATEDQIRLVDYSAPAAMQQTLAAVGAIEEADESQTDAAMDMILPESTPAEVMGASQDFAEESGLVIPVEAPVEAESEPQGDADYNDPSALENGVDTIGDETMAEGEIPQENN